MGLFAAQVGLWKKCMRWLSPTGGITSIGTGTYLYCSFSGGGISSTFLTSTVSGSLGYISKFTNLIEASVRIENLESHRPRME